MAREPPDFIRPFAALRANGTRKTGNKPPDPTSPFAALNANGLGRDHV